MEYNLKFYTDVEAKIGEDGFPLAEDGKPITDPKDKRKPQMIPVDWVSYGPSIIDGKPNTTSMVNEKVRRLMPDNFRIYPGQDGGEMMKVVNARWAVIEPEYQAWKEGREPVTSGTALSTWTTLRSEEMDTLLSWKVRTVEAVSKLTDTQCSKIPLPNAWGLRDLAKEFLRTHAEEEDSAEIAELRRQLEHLKSVVSSGAVVIDEKAEETKALREELDARGIDYDKRIKDPEKLRAILNEKAAA